MHCLEKLQYKHPIYSHVTLFNECFCDPQNEVQVVLADSVEQVLQAAFEGNFPDMSSDASQTKPLTSKL